jgi:hypothetical protein
MLFYKKYIVNYIVSNKRGRIDVLSWKFYILPRCVRLLLPTLLQIGCQLVVLYLMVMSILNGHGERIQIPPNVRIMFEVET